MVIISHVEGMTRNDMGKAPIVDGVHDFRIREQFIPDDDALKQIEWGEVDAEWSYTAMIELESPHTKRPVSALFKHSALHPRFDDDHIIVYGDEGSNPDERVLWTGRISTFMINDEGWQQATVPEAIISIIYRQLKMIPSAIGRLSCVNLSLIFVARIMNRIKHLPMARCTKK